MMKDMEVYSLYCNDHMEKGRREERRGGRRRGKAVEETGREKGGEGRGEGEGRREYIFTVSSQCLSAFAVVC